MIRYQVARGAMELLASNAGASFAALGVPAQDYDLVTGAAPWTGLDRPVVERTLRSLMGGTMDLAGLPRFRTSAEYQAAVIATFVDPANYQVACSMLEGAPSNDMIANGKNELEWDRVTAGQLFALLLELGQEGDVATFRDRFEGKSNAFA